MFLQECITALARNPAATHRKDLADKAARGFAAKIGGEFGVFPGAHQTPQRNLALQSFLEPEVGLNLGRKVGRIVDKVLCDGIHLDIVRRDLHAHGPDAVEFFTRKKTITSRYFSGGHESGSYFVEK